MLPTDHLSKRSGRRKDRKFAGSKDGIERKAQNVRKKRRGDLICSSSLCFPFHLLLLGNYCYFKKTNNNNICALLRHLVEMVRWIFALRKGHQTLHSLNPLSRRLIVQNVCHL